MINYWNMPNDSNVKNNIYKYYSFQFFINLAFFSPVIVLFWQSNGLSTTQFMLLQSIYAIGVVILELPTGAFADYFGKRKSLIIGALLWTLGMFWYGTSHYFWQFIIGELIVGTGAAFISGADRAYIHYLLKSNKKEKEFKKIEGKTRGIIQVAQALGSLIGGFIGSLSLGLSLVATGFSTFLAFLIGIIFPKKIEKVQKEKQITYWKIIKESIKMVRRHKILLWLTLFFALFNGLVWPLMFSSQLYLKMLKIPIYFFGVIFMLINLISAFGSVLTNGFERLTEDKSFLVMTIIVTISLLILAYFPSIYVILLWSIIPSIAFINQTIISNHVLTIVPSEKAATVLSFQSLLRRVVYSIIGPIIGIITDSFGLKTALKANALILVIFLGILLLLKNSFYQFNSNKEAMIKNNNI